MTADRTCPRCGRVIPSGDEVCKICESGGGIWWTERESLILFSVAILIALFVVTALAARFYHAKEAVLAQDWYGRGVAALNSKQPSIAVEDFRTALLYSGDNNDYQLRLAQALMDSGQFDAAQSYLENIWEREPGDGIVNLQLARLYARESNVDQATRYFHSAIYGVWEGNPDAQRVAVRIELSRFLLKWNRKTQAEPELIALVARLPSDPNLHTEVGNFFLEVQDYPRALDQFRSAVKLDKRNVDAWLGAGKAAFQTGAYEEAVPYFETALRLGTKDPEVTMDLDLSRLVLSSDPFERSLSEDERGRRVMQAFNRSLAHLLNCSEERGIKLQGSSAEQGDLQAAYATAMAIESQVDQEELRHHPENSPGIMDSVGQMETAAEKECGPGGTGDRALLLIARKEAASRP